MPKVTGGEAIVESLIAHGVDTIFALPGVQNDYFFNALYDAGDKIRVIHTRHEQGAAYMALGYAMSSERVGVFSVVPGPGLLNASAALATAYSTNSKVLCLTGQIPSAYIGRGFGQLHEIPKQLDFLQSLTKWAAQINSPADAPELVAEAFRQMDTGRPRPVGLECALDVLAAKAEVDLTKIEYKRRHPPVDFDAIARAAEILIEAKNPVIFVGSGAVGAANAIQELAEILQIPVISTRSGHGILSSRHPLSHRLPIAYHLWKTADVVLALGSRAQRSITGWGVDDRLKVIRIDIDPDEHRRYSPQAISIIARCEDAVPQLVQAVAAQNINQSSRAEEFGDLKDELLQKFAVLEPQISFVETIRAALPDNGVLVTDMTQVGYVSQFLMPVYQPRTLISPGYQGTLGWAFATALGVKVANPDKPVLVVAGDGGFMFTVQELAAAVQHQINTVTLVFNDNAYGNVRRMQKNLHGNRIIASDLDNPDFVQLASSFGANGVRVETTDELRSAILDGFGAPGPTIIEIPVGEMPDPGPLYSMPKVR
ncbi:acetolactate synthase [Chloroflexi bacterium TSY]|nr:acetolactate synthase [Chloroflexi bacterium TSY]